MVIIDPQGLQGFSVLGGFGAAAEFADADGFVEAEAAAAGFLSRSTSGFK
jgi:hypothetical protein